MKSLFILPVVLLFYLSWAQEFSLKASKVSGNIQIKREGERKWKKLKKGDEIQDNDIVRTSFKSNCEIKFGTDNIIFMGADSRMLVNIIQKTSFDNEVSITVFSGSAYSKISSKIDYFVYSLTSMAKTSKGIFNCTVDEISGVSGFHVFSGTIVVSNISVPSV